jgi:hypothetical protein
MGGFGMQTARWPHPAQGAYVPAQLPMMLFTPATLIKSASVHLAPSVAIVISRVHLLLGHDPH